MIDDDKPTTPADLEPIRVQLRSQDARLEVVENQLQENNVLTAEIRDILAAGKMGLKVLGGLGSAFRWALGIGAGVATIWGYFHGTK